MKARRTLISLLALFGPLFWAASCSQTSSQPSLSNISIYSKYSWASSEVEEAKFEDFSLFYVPERKGYLVGDYKGQLSAIIVPDEATGKDGLTAPIVGLADRAFYGRKGITTVLLGENISSIGDYAFYGTDISDLRVAGSLTYVGDNAFDESDITFYEKDGVEYLPSWSEPYYTAFCDGTDLHDKLDSSCHHAVIKPGVQTVIERAFSGCSSLESIFIPSSVTSIGNTAFSGCSSLKSVNLPDSVPSIESSLFYGCSSLASIDIPDSVTSIGDCAFFNCSLTSVDIPDSVTSIGDSAFSGCSSLKSMTLPFVGGSASSNSASSSTLFGYIFGTSSYSGGVETKQYYENSTSSFSDYYLPSSLESVKVNGGQLLHGAFYGCSSLRSIDIPPVLTSIGDYAFSGCSSLSSITIPSSVVTIGSSSFSGCSSLTDTYVSISSIPDFLSVGGKENLIGSIHLIAGDGREIKSIDISNSITSIGASAFSGCSSLSSITIPSSVVTIGSSSFSGCSSLTDTYVSISSIPDFLSIKGKENFLGSVHLIGKDGQEIKSVEIPDSVLSLADYAFFGCSSLESIVIPSSVTSIGASAFSGCSPLVDIYFSVSSIPDFLSVSGKENLIGSVHLVGEDGQEIKSIDIPDSVISLADYAFSGCSSLTSITIPSLVGGIGSYAFSGCSALESVTIPSSIRFIGSSAFSGCSSLKSMTLPFVGHYPFLPTGFADSSSLFGWVFGKSSYPGGIARKQYYNDSVSAVFYIPSSLESVTITGGQLFYGAFMNCASLKSIDILDSVTSIDNRAFSGCTSLKSISIPDSLTSIGDRVFYDCSSLLAVNVPASTTSIGESAFFACSSLESIEIPDSVTSIGNNAFSGRSLSLTIYCHAKSKPEGWSDSWNSSNRPVVWGYEG